MTASLSPTRRVLADKTPNASLRRALEPVTKPYLDSTMSEEPRALMKHAFEMEVERNTTPKAGQKRRIHEVDGAEEQEEPGRDRAGLTPPCTTLLAEPTSETDEREFLSASQTTTTTSTLLTSFHASQVLPVPLEDQFDIQDEMSQRTLDQIHATPVPNHTFQPQPTPSPVLVTETSQDSARMSSFIDFEPHDPVDEDLGMIPSESMASTVDRLGKAAMEEKAEALRTRLQLALYKVRTNQVSKPFSRLEQPRSSSPELPPQPPSLGRTSPEGIVAAARARATQQQKPAVRNLNSLPVPTIVPTAYSARYMPVVEEDARLPTSAPFSHAAATSWSEGARSFERSRTPKLSRQQQAVFPKTPMQLSSPSKSDGLGLKHGQGKRLVGQLTSSVVKGEAANGLLELMRAAAA